MNAIPTIASNRDIPLSLYESLSDADMIAGEREAVMLTYLAAQTRRFSGPSFRPVGLFAYGQSSSGKTYGQDLALKAVPADDVVKITGMSPRLLTRKHTEDFAHKIVVFGEAEALRNPDIEYYLRKLFDDGHLVYELLEERTDYDEGHTSYRPRKYELGPDCWFSFMTSSTKPIHAENATRLLTVYSDDSDEQTRRVLKVTARGIRRETDFCFEPWHDFDRWQSGQDWSPKAVDIPYLAQLANDTNISGPALRRSFLSVVTLIAAHALLHRETRSVSPDGKVVATPADYKAVRVLVEPFLAREALVSVPAHLSAVVNAVSALTAPGAACHDTGATARHVIEKLSSSKSTVGRALQEATAAGLLEKANRMQPYHYFAVDGLMASSDISYILPPLKVS